MDQAEPSPMRMSKRTRYGADDNAKEGEEWKGSVHDEGARDVMDDDCSISASPVPSFPFTEEASIAETSATTASKRPNKYICEVEGCGKAFNRPIRLVNHTRSHTKERPFVCDEDDCGKTFTRAEHLTRHKKDKHVEARDHVCTHVLDTVEGG
ncbi:Strongly-conserved Zn-finger binding protein (TFIIIA), partial [Friedmanniomyces endolithicus]